MRQTAPEEAYRKLDEMAAKLTESLRKSTKEVEHLSFYTACWDQRNLRVHLYIREEITVEILF